MYFAHEQEVLQLHVHLISTNTYHFVHILVSLIL